MNVPAPTPPLDMGGIPTSTWPPWASVQQILSSDNDDDAFVPLLTVTWDAPPTTGGSYLSVENATVNIRLNASYDGSAVAAADLSDFGMPVILTIETVDTNVFPATTSEEEIAINSVAPSYAMTAAAGVYKTVTGYRSDRF